MPMLNDKVALITGGSSGIGQKTAELFARQGAKVVICGIKVLEAQKVVQSILDSGGDALFVKTDVSDPRQCESLVRETVEHYGRLDIACNNAGISGELKFTADYSLEMWEKVIAVNLSGVFYCMKYEIPAMLEAGGGSIINVASILGRVGFASAVAYAASKHGILGISETAAVEYAARGIRVNTVGPAFIRTPMIADLEKDEEVKKNLIALHPVGRFGEPEEVAELIAWLGSVKSSFVTGSYYPVDGGYLAK